MGLFLAGFLAAGFFAVGFLSASFFATGFLAEVFFASGFLTADFFADFVAEDFFGLARGSLFAAGLFIGFLSFFYSLGSLKDPEAPTPLVWRSFPLAAPLFKAIFKCELTSPTL